jgi:VanZ family protein
MFKKSLQTPWPTLIWTGLIFFLLTIHTGTMESVPLFGIRNLDKFVHLFLFGVLVWLPCHYFSGKKKLTAGLFLAILLAGVGYGVGMEFYQDRFTTRAFEFGDILADIAGVAAGGFASKVFHNRD